MPPKFRPLKKQLSITDKPPSHSHELDPKHRSFLRRSLDRSDKELAALQTLHRNLRSLKHAIVDKYGEGVLLDIGQGFISLSKEDHSTLIFHDPASDSKTGIGNTTSGTGSSSGSSSGSVAPKDPTKKGDAQEVNANANANNAGSSDTQTDPSANANANTNTNATMNHTETTPPAVTATPKIPKVYKAYATNSEFTAIVRDFLLRFDLRRKILNRLARRIMRLSHAMDGTNRMAKVHPPPAPKYGESRMMSTHEQYSTAMMEFIEREEMKDKALSRIRERRKKIREQEQLEMEEEARERERERYQQEQEQRQEQEHALEQQRGEAEKEKVKEEQQGEMKEEQQKQQQEQVKEEGRMETKQEEEGKTDTGMQEKMEVDEGAGAGAVGTGVDAVPSNDVGSSSTTDQKATGGDTDMEIVKDEGANADAEKGTDTTTPPYPPTSPVETIPMPPLQKLDPLLFDKEHQADLAILAEYKQEYEKVQFANLTNHTTKITSSLVAQDKDESSTTNESVSAGKNDTDIAKINALVEKTEEDFEQEENDEDMRSGIGAMASYKGGNNYGSAQNTMSNREKVQEWKRWQMEFLGKIPDQPTFGDLGMKNHVFDLEERRKKVFEEEAKMKEEKKEENIKSEGGGKDYGGDVIMGGDGVKVEEKSGTEGIKGDESKVKKEKDVSKNTDEKKKESGTAKDDDNSDSSSKASDEEKVKADFDEFKKRKTFSLDPVPSFYDQDQHRALLIHADLMTMSFQENSRKTVAEATAEYNDAYRISTEYQNQTVRLENEREKALIEYRMKLGEYNRAKMMALHKWESEKNQFDTQKIQRMRMQSNVRGTSIHPEVIKALTMDDSDVIRRELKGIADRVVMRNAPPEQAIGTEYLKARFNRTSAHGDMMTSQVLSSLAHCADTVVKRLETGWISTTAVNEGKGGEQFPPFVYRKPETLEVNDKGETLQMVRDRVKRQIKTVSEKLTQCEQVRSQKWQKLMKVKQEAALSERNRNQPGRSQERQRPVSGVSASSLVHAHQQQQSYPMAGTAAAYQRQVTAVQRASVNAAMARQTQQQQQPQQQQPMAYAPTGQAGARAHPMDKKYSVEGVKARTGNDGSVRPVNTPKMLKNGLYMRPAGRQRKGMDWDAVNGRWVPQGSLG